MHFNWLTNLPKDQSFSRLAIELEYELRPRITRYLLRKFEQDFGDDFSSFYFDVDVNTSGCALGGPLRNDSACAWLKILTQRSTDLNSTCTSRICRKKLRFSARLTLLFLLLY
ncbi:hypothetical protein BST99_00910 [Aureicoccus marinus]|uniref:Uncharacterized protein n=1 Tax=Aureicoccus marinus TaxID=754435 RepID=A0A2S7T3K7_9FLAO|nr:hypothetical protein BST99_00910 [Aureicoccus marinus]